MPATMQSEAGWYAVTARSNDEAEIRIYDEIGAFGVTAAAFVRDLAKVTAKTIRLRINTPGGDAFQATAIYNALREHPARVVVQVDGVAASAGSVIAMSGDEIRMADNAYLMIHNAHGGVMGEAADLRNYADMLEKINDNIAVIYERKGGKGAAHWRNLMDAETWMNAEEAKAEGLADTVFTADKPTQAARASFDFKAYNKIPDPVRRYWGLTPPANGSEPQSAPEDSPRGEPEPAEPKETHMADDAVTQAPPAQTPAPANSGIQQGTPPANGPSFTNVQEAIKHFQSVAGPKAFSDGRLKGAEEAATAAVNRLKEIVAVCPNKPQMALTAFLSGQTPEAVKLAYDEAARVEAVAQEAAAAQQIEIARLNALIAAGGHPGVSLALTGADDQQETATGMDPEAQAKYEWDHKPHMRRNFSTKDRYVSIRKAELEGRFTMQVAGASK